MILNKVLYRSVTVFDLIMVAIILVLAMVIGKAVSLYLRRFLKEKLERGHLEILVKIVSYAIAVIALLMILPILGVKLSGLLVAGGIAGLAIGFASQSVIGNLISGFFLMIERPIQIGNAVNIDGTVGIVEDIHIISTTLRTFDGPLVRLPNQKVFTSNITSYAANVARRFDYVVGIRYSDDADKAIEIIKNLIEQHSLTLKNPAPMVFVDSLGDSSVNIIVRIWAPATEWFGVKTELLWKIKKALEQEGIEIPFPQRVVWFGDEKRAPQFKVPESAKDSSGETQ
jgi:small-conductance mechanosensitive channel